MSTAKHILDNKDYFPHAELPLEVKWRDPQPVFPPHSHNFSELLLITRGSAVHVIDDMRFPVSAGDVFVLSGNREHQFVEMDDLALVNVLYAPERLGMEQWDTSALPGFRAIFVLEPEYREQHQFKSRLGLSGSEMRHTLSLIQELSDEVTNAQPGFKLDAKAIFMRLLVYLSRCYENKAKDNPQSQSLLRIAKAIDYLDRHYAEDIDYNKLGRIAHMSLRNFQRTFRKAINCSAQEYVTRLRIRNAMEQLKHSEDTISEIAMKCGFSDSNYFTRSFKKYSGVTPRNYRSANAFS